jgi:hypothetical protein
MPVALEMLAIVREAAEPSQPGESVKAAIGRAARRLGLSFARVHGIWYGRARQITAEEADTLRRRRAELARARLSYLQAQIDAQQALITAMERGRAA